MKKPTDELISDKEYDNAKWKFIPICQECMLTYFDNCTVVGMETIESDGIVRGLDIFFVSPEGVRLILNIADNHFNFAKSPDHDTLHVTYARFPPKPNWPYEH